jgi:hypothetical protein
MLDKAQSQSDTLVIPLIATGTAAYLVMSALLAWKTGHFLVEGVATYKPEVTWTFSSANNLRAWALIDGGRMDVAALYRRLEQASMLFIIFSMSVGAVSALLRPRFAQADPLALMGLTIASVVAYSAFANGGTLLCWLEHAGGLPASIGAWPAFWFGSIAVASLLIAWTGGLLLHDLIVLALTRRERRASIGV